MTLLQSPPGLGMRLSMCASSLLIAVLDQKLKVVMASYLSSIGGHHLVFPGLQLWLIRNSGAGFGLLSDTGAAGELFLLIVSVLVSIFLLIWLWWPSIPRFEAIAASLVLGGAMGNLYDRALSRPVVDFIYVHIGSWGIPAFNLADAAITLGAILLIWQWYLPHGRKAKAVRRVD